MTSRPPRLLLLGAFAAFGTLAAALAPGTEAAARVPAVKGGLVQAYQAVAYVKPTPPVVPVVRYYLSGTASDEQNKLASTPSATFSKTKPSGTSDITQQTSPVVGLATAGSQDKSSAFWTAPYRGRIKGRVTVNWYWSTPSAAASSGNLILRLWADPGTSKEKELAKIDTGVPIGDAQPHPYSVSFEVNGVVGSTLRLQGSPRYVDTGQGLTAHYGSASSPSYVELPTGATAPPTKLPSTRPVRDTNPLVLSATKIGRKASEPTIGVMPDGRAFITASDFDGLSPATPRTLIYSSTDGNASWHNVSALVAGQPTPPTTLDPYLFVDPDTGRVYNDDLTVGCSYLQWTDDGGKTWSRGNPLACEAPVDDHQTLVTGHPIAGLTTTGYPKIVYYCVNKVGDAQCARSLDGGTVFTPTGQPAFVGYEQPTDANGGASGLCGGLHGHIATDPTGRLMLPKGHCSRPMLAISEDGGANWRQVLVNRMLTASSQTAVASDSKGNLYYTWIGKDDLLPYLAVSRDHGRSWGPALLIAPPGVAAVNFPSIDASDPGHIAISFPGTTDRQTSAARPWNYYVTVTTDALAGRPTFHSATANPVKDPVHRGPCLGRCAGMFDFLDLVIAPRSGEVWAALSDTCTSVACVSAEGPGLSKAEAASDAQGIAIRMLSGPGRKR